MKEGIRDVAKKLEAIDSQVMENAKKLVSKAEKNEVNIYSNLRARTPAQYYPFPLVCADSFDGTP
jgi:hypothetical protein